MKLKLWISILALAGATAMLVDFSDSAWADTTNWPCDGAGCQETCKYLGKIDLGGSINIQTVFTRDKTNPKNFSARTLIILSASVLFWRIEYFIDEEDIFDSNPERLRRVDVNSRYILNGNLKRQTWDRSDFNDGPAPGAGYTEAYRVEGTNPTDFAKRYGAFSEFFPVSAFANNWQPAYEAAKPDRRTDMDLRPVLESIMSPITMDFIKARFLDPNLPHKFQGFMNGHPNPNAPLLELTRAPNPNSGSGSPSSTDVLWNVDLSFISDVQNSPDQPSVLVVDPATHVLKEVQLHLRDSILSVNATTTLQGCQITN